MPGKSQAKDVDQAVTEPGAITQLTPFQRALRQMESDATLEVSEGTFSGDDLNPILTAETEEELWEADEQGPLNAQLLAGCELGITDVSVKYSRGGKEQIKTPFVTSDGRKMYLMVTAYRLSDAGDHAKTVRLPAIGESFQFNTSARYLTMKIWAFYTKGYIGDGKTLEGVIRETDLGDGTGVLKLRPMPRRAVRTETSE